ncbi:hypothetical protein F511_41999 [Dorcoceras hygrometricum]|uniref:Uncharacterized protein n=1 Tax=Dorcoceras hygrometricum TaxID=472368 RepID=A0A2Z7A8B7_9LAMI|nr:hypothetical protein F511_41999 [Dorcoceras hygrometricum]
MKVEGICCWMKTLLSHRKLKCSLFVKNYDVIKFFPVDELLPCQMVMSGARELESSRCLSTNVGLRWSDSHSIICRNKHWLEDVGSVFDEGPSKLMSVYQPGKSLVRDIEARQPSQLDGFQTQLSVGHHSDDSVVPFRHDTSVCRSQCGSISGSQPIKGSIFLPQQISPGHGNLSLLKRATSLVMPNSAGTCLELNSKISRTPGSSFAKTFDQHCYFALLSSVDSGHLTGINRKSYSRRAQLYQSRSKQRRKSMAIYQRRVRINSNYRGFTGENDEKYRVQKYAKCSAALVSRGNRHFTVDCGRLRQSGPRPKMGFLHQPALEGLTRSARTDSPRQVGRNNFPTTQGGGGTRAAATTYERREGAATLL